MKRMYYVSRFARALSNQDLSDIHETAVRNNRRAGVTGFLVCLGDTFFQVLEGPAGTVEKLYHDKIVPDDRHKDVLCLKAESGVTERMFPEWSMEVFNLNEEQEVLPFAFRQMLTALLESSHTIAQYTQPYIFQMLERGVNPSQIQPRRRRVTVLFSDIIGFSNFAAHSKPGGLIELVNSHVEVCAQVVDRHGGQVNKLTGDGVLAYFTGTSTDGALKAAVGILDEMQKRRSSAQKTSAQRQLHGGVGLANGLVFEGNVGPALKRDFTILGNTVNQASRLESITRELNVRLTLDASIVKRAQEQWPFVSLGKRKLKGRSREVEIYTLESIPKLNANQIYRKIEAFFGK